MFALSVLHEMSDLEVDAIDDLSTSFNTIGRTRRLWDSLNKIDPF